MDRIETSSMLQSRVLALLQYFDILDYPLTTAELFQRFPSPVSPSLSSIEEALNTDTAHKDSPIFKDGFWCLAGRESIIEVRRQRYASTEQKYQFLRPFLWIMKHFPFVKSIFVTNTLSYDNAKDESDIDLFFVCAKDKIWTVRFWCLVFLTLLCRRPSPSHAKKNMICANFLVSESKLELESIAIKDHSSHAPKDIHLAHLLASLVPLYDPENNILHLGEKNSWVGAFFRWPASLPCFVGRGRAQQTLSCLGKCIKNFLEWICNPRFIERMAKQYQLSILPTPLREGAQKQDTNVVISDTILKFHLNDRREEIWTKWNTRLKG